MKTNVYPILNQYFEGTPLHKYKQEISSIAKDFKVNTLIHNPRRFETKVTIEYKLGCSSMVSLVIYHTKYRFVAYQAVGYRIKGFYRMELDVGNLPPGLYIACLRTGDSLIIEYMNKVSNVQNYKA